MNFYDKIHELVRALKDTEDYKEFISLKEKIRKDEKKFQMLKDFKQRQAELQLSYMKGEKMQGDVEQNMQNLYSLLIQDENTRKLLECEMKINVMLADMQKIVSDGIKEIVEF